MALLKVTGGKMLRAWAEIADGRLTRVRVTGDFFLHPEETIEAVESSLEGVNARMEDVLRVILASLGDADLIGASARDVAEVVLAAAGLPGSGTARVAA